VAEEKELRLKVGELTAREEAGRGIVRIDSNIMHKLGIREGDVVEIEGGRKTAAIAVRAYPADVGLNIIRMDGIMRRNAESGVGEFVKLRKADVKEAKKVSIAPAEKGLIIHISPNLIKQNIYMRPVTKGDVIIPSPVVRRKTRGTLFDDFFGFDLDDFFFTPFPGETRFIVTNTDPHGIVKIGDMTNLEILPELPESMKIEERVAPAATYEDIGGMKTVIQKVREMIELPLRHPELFERLGVEPPKGVLLYGPPGTGKTLLARAVASESGANFISISGPEVMSKWYGQSLSADQEILVRENGLIKRIPIGEIVEKRKNVEVLAFDNSGKVKWRKVSDFIKHKNRSKILEITTRSGRKIKVTDDHSLFTLKGTKIAPIKTSELIPKTSYIAVPRITPVNSTTIGEIDFIDALRENDFGLRVRNIQKYIQKAKKKIGDEKAAQILNVSKKYLADVLRKNVGIRVSRFLELMQKCAIEIDKNEIEIFTKGKSLPAKVKLTEDFLRFLGYWMAEGSYTNKNEVRLSINKNEEKIVKNLCESLFGKVTSYPNKKSNGLDIHINSTILGIFMKNILELEGGAKNKHIPAFVFNLDLEKIASFLRGYFSGDGSLYLNQRGVPTVEATTYSKRLANDLIYLLSYFGISSKNYGKGKFRICFAGSENMNKFTTIGFDDSKKNQMINIFLSSIKWNRYDQIPITESMKNIRGNIYQLRAWRNSATIGRGILGNFSDDLSGLEFGFSPSEIRSVISSDIYWDRVEEIKEVENEEYVYDISVPGCENFVAGFGGIFAHNSEENLRKIFEDAEKNSPSIIFIDEIDSIAPKREEVTGEVERRVVSQLLTLMDGLKKRGKVVVVAATNRPNAVDPALRRPGRFDREIEIPVPNRNGRLEILKIHTRNMPMSKEVDLNWLADITYGYVGADLWALAKEAAMSALRRVLPQIKWKEEAELPREVMEKLVVTKEDFENALHMVEPSAMREVLVEIPKVKWSDIGGLENVKQALKEMVEWPLKSPESFERLGIEPPRGILLYGPPGTGKTLLAKAVANESGANFISVKGPELKSKWVGESERLVRDLFKRAKQVAPTVIFFDEIDALAPKRGGYYGEHATESIVSQLLTELSGIEEMKGVVVIAATNRPDMVDPALLRPGRFDRQILVPAPDEQTRLEILKIQTKNMPMKDVDLKKIAAETEGYSGADLEALVREAALDAIRENMKAKEVRKAHFEAAMKKVKGSLTREVQAHYEKFIERQKRVRKTEEEMKEQYGYIG